MLARDPVRSAAKQALDESNLVGDEQAEGQTDESGSRAKAAIQPGGAGLSVGDSRSHSHSDDHHSGNGADTEDDQIGDGPSRIVDRRQHQECDSG